MLPEIMNCLRSLFSSCCCVSAPTTEHCLFEQAISPADKQRSQLAAHLTSAEILVLVADYAAGKYPRPADIETMKSSGTHLQKLLIPRRVTELPLKELLSADKCAEYAKKAPSIAMLTITKGIDPARILFLQAFKTLRFIWMRDFAFSLELIPRFAQLPQLVGLDITLSKEAESLMPRERRQALDLEILNHTPAKAVSLFEEMPALAYLHIRGELYLRHDRVKRLSQDCRDYIRTKDPSLPSDEELDTVSNKPLGAPEKLKRTTLIHLQELAHYRFAELTKEQIARYAARAASAHIAHIAATSDNTVRTPFSQLSVQRKAKRLKDAMKRAKAGASGGRETTEPHTSTESASKSPSEVDSKASSEAFARPFAMSPPKTAFARYQVRD